MMTTYHGQQKCGLIKYSILWLNVFNLCITLILFVTVILSVLHFSLVLNSIVCLFCPFFSFQNIYDVFLLISMRIIWNVLRLCLHIQVYVIYNIHNIGIVCGSTEKLNRKKYEHNKKFLRE